MIKVGDTVKVIGMTLCGGIETECIKIGTVCKVVEIENRDSGSTFIGIVPERELLYGRCNAYWYLPKDIEKGHMEWIRESEE